MNTLFFALKKSSLLSLESKYCIHKFCTSIFISLLVLSSCNPESVTPDPCSYNDNELGQLSAYQQTFIAISFGNEFGEDYQYIRKWEGNVDLFVPEYPGDSLMKELLLVIDELNDLSETTQINVVDQQDRSNFIAYFGDKETYASVYAPEAANFISSNLGLFFVNWNSSFQITKGSFCIDIANINSLDCQNHLIREELTQALGLFNDIPHSPESIFHQGFVCTPAYTETDRQIIRDFLSTDILAGMCAKEVTEYVF